ncbi:MAG TPA: hypothetical protein VK484_13715, partial [Ferruginibacter sp.]|nr:hypothetical protein [Ferruginibacter sp.]
EKFKPYSYQNGRILFISICAACHHKNKMLIGPPLTRELLNSRTNDWFYTFFKDRKNLIEDSAYLARKKIYRDNKCIELPEYSQESIGQLISYLKGR